MSYVMMAKHFVLQSKNIVWCSSNVWCGTSTWPYVGTAARWPELYAQYISPVLGSGWGVSLALGGVFAGSWWGVWIALGGVCG
jgi:hypothetical protein